MIGIIALIHILVIANHFWFRKKRKRRKDLLAKYGEKSLVKRIMSSDIWHGMTADQLYDSWGKAESSDRQGGSKSKQTLHYLKSRKNRAAWRVILEDGIVIHWEEKYG